MLIERKIVSEERKKKGFERVNSEEFKGKNTQNKGKKYFVKKKIKLSNYLESLVRLEGLEPPVLAFVAPYFIQLNYKRIYKKYYKAYVL